MRSPLKQMARCCMAVRGGDVAVLVCGADVAFGISARAEITTLIPVADGYVRSTAPAGNHGTDSNIIANNNNGVRVSFLHFDLGGITNSVLRLKLELTVYIASANNVFDVFGLASGNDWNEGQMTWTNAPAIVSSFTNTNGTQTQYFRAADCYGGDPLTSFVSAGTSTGQVNTVFDVTNGAVLNYVASRVDKIVTYVIVEQYPVDVPGNA